MTAEPVHEPLSISGLAARLGAPRQRVYAMAQRGQIRVIRMAGALVVPAEEANRVLEAAVLIESSQGPKLVFNFI